MWEKRNTKDNRDRIETIRHIYQEVIYRNSNARIAYENERVNTDVEVRIIFNFIKNLFNDTNDIQLLDVGTGYGRLAIPLSKMGIKVTALDIAEKNFPKIYHGVHFRKNNFLTLDTKFRQKFSVCLFGWTSFGIIFANWIELVETLLHTISTLLTTKGVVIVDNVTDLDYLHAIATKKIMYRKGIYIFFESGPSDSLGNPTAVFYNNSLIDLFKKHKFLYIRKQKFFSSHPHPLIKRPVVRNYFIFQKI